VRNIPKWSNRVKRSGRAADSFLMMRSPTRVVATALLSSLVALLLPILVAAPARAATEGPSTIAFTRSAAGNTDVYTISSDGTGLERVTNNAAVDRDPAWSPSGKRIVFSSNRAGTFDLWEKDPATGWARQLTHGPAADRQPSWSPDGSSIAFIRSIAGHAAVWLLDMDTMGATRLTHNTGNDAHPSWVAGGDWLLYDSLVSNVREVCAIRSDGTGNYEINAGPGNNSDPNASPNRISVAFVTDRSTGPAIWTWDSVSQNATALTNGSTTDGAPAWSTYGTMLVFTRESGGATHLFTMSSDGTNQMQLTTGTGVADTSPTWAPLTDAERTQDDQVKNSLLRVENDADTFYASDGSYVNVTVFHLSVQDPYFVYTTGASTGPIEVSIDVSGSSSETFAEAIMPLSGECFLLRVTDATTVTYGITSSPADCTGAYAAANATASSGWPV